MIVSAFREGMRREAQKVPPAVGDDEGGRVGRVRRVDRRA
jgi:hypothetical protein